MNELFAPVYSEAVGCPECDYWFVGAFRPQADSPDEPPVGEHWCPRCSHRFASAMTDWSPDQ